MRAVVVVALDRLGRSMSGIIATVRELDRVGCAVVSLRESWLDTGGPARELLLAVFGWVAQEERRILVARTVSGLERARRHGTRSGKPIGRPKVSWRR
ncbi:recombinase family protein [Pyxidicoccus sp. QH1ED-7-1]|nr:recombinase family protein [Pyxidicoccus xibeiensis]MCP3139907.1 recombinase family protein [Pyxidicoccus xibeiensis]